MAWSTQIGRLFGIPIRLHITFLLLMAWLGIVGVSRGDIALALQAIGLFLCVLAHELGHCLVARRYGIPTKDITLLPIGGLANLGAVVRVPRQELWIAAAGPAVNFVLALAFWFGARVLESPLTPAGPWDSHGHLLGKLMMVNLSLGLFNLIPAFPLDGGRILRAVLAEGMGDARASQLAAGLGQLLAFGLGFVGLLGNPLLIFIALFIFIGATEEGARAQTRSAIDGVTVRDATMTQFASLNRSDTLGRAIDLLLAGPQHDFPVREGEEVVGVLTRQDLLRALATHGRDRYVSEVMQSVPAPVSEDTPLEEALNQMAITGARMVPVHSGEGLRGVLTSDNMMEYVLVRSALARESIRGA